MATIKVTKENVSNVCGVILVRCGMNLHSQKKEKYVTILMKRMIMITKRAKNNYEVTF